MLFENQDGRMQSCLQEMHSPPSESGVVFWRTCTEEFALVGAFIDALLLSGLAYGGDSLLDLPLQRKRFFRKFGIRCPDQIGIQPTFMFDRTDSACRKAQAHCFAQRVRQKRRILQVGQKPTARFVVRVAYIISCLHAFASHGAFPGHTLIPETLRQIRKQDRPWSGKREVLVSPVPVVKDSEHLFPALAAR